MNKPCILIYVSSPEEKIQKEICAGIEEEGVLFEIVEKKEKDINTLAYDSANDSILGTGIGIREDSCMLTLSSLPKNKNIFCVNQPSNLQARYLGANAARIVKRKPFKEVEKDLYT